MILYRLTVFALLLGLLAQASAQAPTTVTGTAPDYAGHALYLYGYSDVLSQNKELLDSTRISAEGDFALGFDSERIRYVELVAAHAAAHFYTMPGTAYTIEFPLPGSDQTRTFARKSPTEVIFQDLDLGDVNALIIDFNQNYEIFFQTNYERLSRLFAPRNYAALHDTVPQSRPVRSSVKEIFERSQDFAALMDSVYAEYDHPYFQLYRSSVMGDLMMNSAATPREIYETYLEPYAYDPQHPEYSRLHERFYKHYLARYSQSYGEEQLDSVINELGDYSALKDLLAKDDFLADPERMDVVILYALAEVWRSNALDHAAMLQIIRQMEAQGATTSSRAMAGQMARKLSACKQGFAPMDFSFTDEQGLERQISEFEGRPLLIEFWAPWCTRCEIEQTRLDASLERYKDLVQVLSVEVMEPGEMAQGRSSGKDIISTSISTESDWIRYYEVRSLPYYVLIDTEGKVMQDNCPRPSEGLEAVLHKLEAAKKDRGRGRVGGRNN